MHANGEERQLSNPKPNCAEDPMLFISLYPFRIEFHRYAQDFRCCKCGGKSTTINDKIIM
jgi:hypothetical protein